MTPGQQQALAQLAAVARARPAALTIVDTRATGALVVAEVSLDLRGVEHRPIGVVVRERERFDIFIWPTFPFRAPSVWVKHNRWKGTPHVQWLRSLCLYRSRAEWDPSDGMFGFLDRLIEWVQKAAVGELDPIGAPLHPPVAYPADNTPMVVVRADTPAVESTPWLGFAEMVAVTDHRIDITGWHELRSAAENVAPAVLLARALPFEFPRLLAPLLEQLAEAGCSKELLIRLLYLGLLKRSGDHVYMVVGTPMRGTVGKAMRQHLAVWRLDAERVRQLDVSLPEDDDSEELRELRGKLAGLLEGWAKEAKTEWCEVREDRDEVTLRRDTGSPLAWWCGRAVQVLGCGAVGARVAEHLARGGVRHLHLRDNANVAPGVLQRQPYEDLDIGANKAEALADRLRRIRPDLDVTTSAMDIVVDETLDATWADGFDVVIDATASPAVSKRLELARRRSPGAANLVSLIVGHTSRNGLVVVAPAGASGGGEDAFRKAKLAASRQPALAPFRDEFWPDPPRTELFQPEPGCSDPTFTGGDAEAAALAGALLDSASQHLAAAVQCSSAVFVGFPTAAGEPGSTRPVSLPNDITTTDQHKGYDVRIAPSALAEMTAWASRSERLSRGAETGGYLFGRIDDAVGVVWVTDVLGPPPDSVASPEGFVCGTEGVDEAAAALDERSGGESLPVGTWHTHPGMAACPSPTDHRGMAQIVTSRGRPLPRQLLVILGGSAGARTIGAYQYDRDRLAFSHPADTPMPERPPPSHRIGLALSGGGFRAVAFHLGVMRALHDRGVLNRVNVLSTVSGGSVIGSMWAYSTEPFDVFDERVCDLLRRGLTADIVRRALRSTRALQAAGSVAIAASAKAAATALGLGKRLARRGPRRNRGGPVEPPVRRAFSRTSAFEDVLAQRLFGDATINEPARDLVVVINACELRTGTAFRFGSQESGSWQYGKLTNNAVPVAHAVAASAAFPVLLPAFDERHEFRSPRGDVSTERVILTDGGVYDNLGVTCLEPGRSAAYSTNVHPVDYILSADAGHGALDRASWPLLWPSRMKRSFESVYRKAQDAGKADLHQHTAAGGLRGFALAYLGMTDGNLPVKPADLVPRSAVAGYPTDFAPMSSEDLRLLSLRGEQLTRLVIDHHCPEIA